MHRKMHRRGSEWAMSTPLKLILMILIVIISVVIYNRFIKSQQIAIGCKTVHGDCVPSTCSFRQIPYLGDKAVGCHAGEICCINITESRPQDQDCSGKKFGDACGTGSVGTKYCSFTPDPKDSVCTDMCDFCAANIGIGPAGQDTVMGICGNSFKTKYVGYGCKISGNEEMTGAFCSGSNKCFK